MRQIEIGYRVQKYTNESNFKTGCDLWLTFCLKFKTLCHFTDCAVCLKNCFRAYNLESTESFGKVDFKSKITEFSFVKSDTVSC